MIRCTLYRCSWFVHLDIVCACVCMCVLQDFFLSVQSMNLLQLEEDKEYMNYNNNELV